MQINIMNSPHVSCASWPPVLVFTDSQEGCRQILLNHLCKDTADVINRHSRQYFDIIWTPWHVGMPGNEAANTLARAVRLREPQTLIVRWLPLLPNATSHNSG